MEAHIDVTPTWFVTADVLAVKEIVTPKFVIDSLIPVGLSVLAAPPKTGKSFFALQAALAVATGTPFLGLPTDQGSVLYLALEDNESRLQDRTAKLTAEGAPPPKALAFAMGADVKSLEAGLVDQLREWHSTTSNPKLVIVDTYGRVMPKMGSGSAEYQQQTSTLGGLQQLALELGIGILMIHHTNKKTDSVDEFDRINGSTAIFAVADSALLLERHRGLNTGNMSVTGRDFAEDMNQPLAFQDGRWTAGTTDQLASLGLPTRLEQICRLLKDSPMTTSDLADELGITANNVATRMNELIKSGHVKRIEHGVYALAEWASSPDVEEFDLSVLLEYDTDRPDGSRDMHDASPTTTSWDDDIEQLF